MSGTIQIPNYNFLAADPGRSFLDTAKNALDVQSKQYDVQQKQAEQAIGNILQQSTDAQGNVDYNGAQRRAAAAGPIVQMRMQDFLGNNANRRGQQIEQGSAFYDHTARSSMSLMNDPSDANLEAVRGDLKRSWPGMGSQIDAEIDAAKQMSPADRVKWAYRHGVGAMDAGGRMGRSPYGSTKPTTLGDVEAPGTTTQATPWNPAGTTYGPATTIGPPPGETYETGRWVSDGKGGRTWQDFTAPKTNLVPPGGRPAGTPQTGGSNPSGAAPSSSAPPPAAFPPAYNGRGTPTAPPGLGNPANAGGGKRSDLGGGVQVASADSSVPSLGAAAPPSAAVPGDVSAILGGMQNARTTPSGGVQTAQNYPPAGTPLGPSVFQTPEGPISPKGPPMGTGELMKNDIQISNDASKEAYDQRLNLGYGEKALEALRMAKGYTGPGTGVASNMYAFLQAHDPTGAIPQGTMSETAWRQVLAKNLIQFAQNTGMKANTDLGLATQLEGNPNVDRMLGSANEHVLVERIGLARQKLAQSLEVPPPSGEGAVAKHVRTFANNTDPRGFAWELYTPEQQAAINKEVEGNKTASDKLHKAMGIAARLGLNQQRLAPPPVAAPPPPTTTPTAPLAMAQPNALAAYA